jgi:transketolase
VIKNLNDTIINLRKKIVKICWLGKAGHLTSSLSSLDILVALYFGGILKYDCKNPDMEDRDRFILSKGHAVLALYNILCDAGFFAREKLNTFCKPGSIFGAEPTSSIPGIEGATGSLGHGLSFGIGIALSARLKKKDYITYVLTGDAECQEGCIWEAAMTISQYRLANLVWIIDFNERQVNDRVDNIMNLSPLDEKLKSFGFNVVSVDGHNYANLIKTLKVNRKDLPIKPLAVIAHTIKGKGIPLIEDKGDWHGRIPCDDEFNVIIEQLGIDKREFLEL